MALLDDIHKAQEKAQEKAREAQEQAQQTLTDAQHLFHEAQERALILARERAQEAQDRARRAAELMPPGLLVRILSSIVGIPLLIALVFTPGNPAFPAWPFTVAVGICASVGAWEYFRAVRMRGFRPTEGLAFVAIVLLQFAAWNVSRGQLVQFLPALLALLVIATLIHQVLRRDPEPLANIGVTFLGVVYVGWLMSYLVFLRSLPGTIQLSVFGAPIPQELNLLGIPLSLIERGAWFVLYVFAVTWMTDTGAYFIGMRFGKNKLAPRLSPKKTVEGAIGGVLAAMLMSALFGTWIGIPWYHSVLLGPLLGVLGEIGDLCESAIKRDLGLKDFGAVLPGHGGILDRFDSILFTAPVAYYYLVFFVTTPT
jgi:phosphatidate cytidylyltransferase